jgi:cytochrome c biogenesis protein ResB
VLLVRIVEGNRTLHQGLVRIGAEATIGDYHIQAPELKNWVNLSVSREYGLTILIFGMLVGIAGLFVRFMSNERRLTFTIVAHGTEANVHLRGYSRYYPAFLEKEVRTVAEEISREERS